MMMKSGPDWISTTEFLCKVESNAGLKQVYWALTYNQQVSLGNLAKQRKLAIVISENKDRLAKHVLAKTFTQTEKTLLRSVYLQHVDALERIERNISVISAFMDQADFNSLEDQNEQLF